MSIRTWVRGLKKIDFNEELLLSAHVHSMFPELNFPSGITGVEMAAVAATENPNISVPVLKELYGFLPKKLLDSVGVNPAKHRLTAVRRAVVERFGEESPLLLKLRLPKAVYNKVNKEYRQKVVQQNADPTQIPAKEIERIVISLLMSNNLHEQLILLQLTSGARSGELLLKSEFERVPGREHWITQTGLSKVKDGENRSVDKPIIIISVDQWLSIFRNVQEKLKMREGVNINNALNARIKNLFGIESFTSHDLRKLYANLSWITWGVKEKNTPSQASWTARVLGHAADNITTAASYTTRAVTGAEALPDQVVKPAAVPIPRNTKARDGKSFGRLTLTAAALEKNGIAVTARELRKYGFGAKSIAQWMKARRPA
jgi:integrase